MSLYADALTADYHDGFPFYLPITPHARVLPHPESAERTGTP